MKDSYSFTIKKELIMVIIFGISFVWFYIFLELYDDYNKAMAAPMKCAQHEKRNWPDEEKKALCKRYVPLINELKKFLP